MASIVSILAPLLLRGALAQDTGAPPLTPEAIGAGPLVAEGAPAKPASFSGYWPPDWPPDSLPTVSLPEDPSQQVRPPGARQVGDRDQELAVEVLQPWPVWVEKGYLPLRLTVENLADRARVVELSLAPEYAPGGGEARRALALDAGERRVVDLAVPGFGPGMASYALSVGEAGSRRPLSLYGLGAPSWAGPADMNVLWVGAEPPALGLLDRWTRATPFALWSSARHEDLPRGPDALAAWTSLDLVVLEIRGGLPSAEALAPLLAWVRLGGTLLLRGPEQPLPPELEAWTEPRFALTLESGAEVGRAWSMGHGVLAWTAREEGWDQAPLSGLAWELIQRGRERLVVPDPSTIGQPLALAVRMDGVGELPRGTLSLVLIGLALLLGPLNLGLVALSRRPPLLLLSTPLLAFGSSAALVAWGLLRDGLDIKVQSSAVTVLDQRLGRASTQEGRLIYAGRAQREGLRPGAGTVVLPVDLYAQSGWRVEGEQGRELSGARFLPTRQKVELRVLGDRESARSLELADEAGRPVATNRLGAGVLRLVLHRADGSWWLGEDLADGASAGLRAATREQAAGWVNELADLALPMNVPGGDRLGEDGLPPGTWLATLDGQPFRDDLGLQSVDLPGHAAVYGVLEGP